MKRIHSIDFMRGLVMIIMAIDHTRDLLHVNAMTQDPLDLKITSPALFFTRWITHLCAPTFVFLSGVSVWLSYQQHENLKESRQFLLKRGIFLIFLEFTIINFGIWFDIHFHVLLSQVIAAIGIGFIILSFLMRLPPKTIGIIGCIIIASHNLLSNVNFPVGTIQNVIWGLLFKLSVFPVNPQFSFFINYPYIPWLGIMMAGFGFAQYFYQTDDKRRKALLKYGIGALIVFVLLRTYNLYGDTQPWSFQKNALFSFFSYINVNKYPPSLLYVCITLGITLCVLYLVDGVQNKLIIVISVYGKVPLFYYILHWYIIHTITIVIFLIQGFKWPDLNFGAFGFGRPQQGGGLDLGGVYAIWFVVIVALYPLCKWYGQYKANHRDIKWLRYL